MDSATLTLFGGLIGVIVGPGLTYIIASRKLSGDIKTSEAAQLWQESAMIRKEYREEITRLRDAEAVCQGMLIQVQQELTKLQEKIAEINAKNIKAIEPVKPVK